MKRLLLCLFFFLVTAAPSLATQGVVTIDSNHTVKETADRLENVLNAKGMTIFNRIRHSEAAQNIGVDLRPTELIIFGNPKVGSPLMQCEQTVAIDLPQKALIWEGPTGRVHISYNDPAYLQGRHSISGCAEVLARINKALAGITRAAAGSD